MSVFNYRKFKITIDENSKKTQGLHVGDIVRRQYFDYPNMIYTLMCVLEIGVDKTTVQENGVEIQKRKQWFIGALLEGDEPNQGEILDFVRVTNLWDANRLGALYITSSDEQAPYIDIIDGIAVEKSLCYPTGINNVSFEDGFSQYVVKGKEFVNVSYKENLLDNYRICSISRNRLDAVGNEFIGLEQVINSNLVNPNRVLISYKIKSSKPMDNIAATLQYEDGTRVDGSVAVSSTTEWSYKFHAITLEFSGRYKRKFTLDIHDNLKKGDSVEISDLNIILLSDVATFADGMKARIGKMSGITDPVFGELEDYGVYSQRLYATKQVNISGTLTAGDENGFGCTFYAGKIHKNVVINSTQCNFLTKIQIIPDKNPVGVGEVYKSSNEIVLIAQNREWANKHVGKTYCFSFWAKGSIDTDIVVSQNDSKLKIFQISTDWKRYSFSFKINEITDEKSDFLMRIWQSDGELFFTAPQLESGKYATQYQPTDELLNETEDYGAWFSRGGIGGTIQNPFLRLNYDGTGAIDTRTKSFRLNQDGSGYLANTNIKWNSGGKVTFGKDVTLDWDNLGQEAQDEMANRYMRITGQDTFTIIGQEDSSVGKTCSPTSIIMTLEEVGFKSTSSQRKWYLLIGNEWEEIPGVNGQTFEVFPDDCYWLGYVTPPPTEDPDGNPLTYHGESQITFKCVVALNESRVYVDTFNVTKQYVQGYTLQVTSSKGNAFQNGICSTVLTANVYYQGQPVNTEYALEHFTFTWHRYKNDDRTTDLGFDDLDVNDGANVLTINYEMDGTDVFVCELGLADNFDYSFPIIF